MDWVQWVLVGSALLIGILTGGAIASILYERKLAAAVSRRPLKVSRISKLDLFELPQEWRSTSSPPPDDTHK